MKGKTASNILHFSIAVVLSKIIGAATTFCVASILIPADYGVWSTLTLVISLSTIFLLGSVETLVKQVPYYLGESNENMVARTDGGVLASVYLSSGGLLFISFVFLFSGFGVAGRSLVHYIQITLLTAAISLFTCFYYYRFSAFSHFKEVSVLNSLRAVLTFLIVIALGWKWHLMGMIVGGFGVELSLLVLSVKLNRRLERPIRLNFNAGLLWNLIKIGFPITMVWWVYMVMSSIGRIISIGMLGKTATGYYSLGVSIVSLIILVPAAIGQVLYPQVSERVGGKASPESISRYVVFPAQIMSLVIPLMLGVLLLVTPFALHVCFPKYIPSILSAQILISGAFFACFIKNGVNYLVAHDKQAEVFAYVLASLAMTVLVTVSAIKMHYDIQGVAAGTVAGCLLLTTLIWKSVFKKFGCPLPEQWKKIVQLYTPFFVMLAVFVLITGMGNRCIPDNRVKLAVTVPSFIVLYLSALFPIPFLRSWSTALVRELKRRN